MPKISKDGNMFYQMAGRNWRKLEATSILEDIENYLGYCEGIDIHTN